MAERFRDELAKLLDGYDERRLAVEARERQVKLDDARFLTGFAELRRDVVRPVFEATREILAQRGHEATITEQEFGADASGKPTEAAITIRIVASGTQPLLRADDSGRSLSIVTRHYNKTLSLLAPHTATTTGVKSAYGLEQIDRALVEDQVLKFVAEIVAA